MKSPEEIVKHARELADLAKEAWTAGAKEDALAFESEISTLAWVMGVPSDEALPWQYEDRTWGTPEWLK